MRLIDLKTLQGFWARHPDAEGPLTKWSHIAQAAGWQSLQDVRRIFPAADAVTVGSGRTATVFNIGGNKYRLITAIHYNGQVVFLMMVLSHKDYDTGKWKEQL